MTHCAHAWHGQLSSPALPASLHQAASMFWPMLWLMCKPCKVVFKQQVCGVESLEYRVWARSMKSKGDYEALLKVQSLMQRPPLARQPSSAGLIGRASNRPLWMQAAEEEKLMEEFRKQGVKLPEKPAGSAWDSNIITPGTAFMHRLSVALQYYVHLRLNNDPGWRGITVILLLRLG